MRATLWATSGDVRLAVHRWGQPAQDRPTVVLVHGYPDTHAVWSEVAQRLAPAHDVVTYDVRGAGASDVPRGVAAYRVERLLDDLAAVLDAAAPGRRVHLVGHDWGSIQGWEAVLSGRFDGRLASFTAISGPPLDHAALWMRQRLTSLATAPDALRQLSRSWYVAFFHLPVLPPLVWRAGAARAFPHLLAAEGITHAPAPTLPRDGRHGVNLYRANFLRPMARPQRRTTDLPVRVIVPSGDPYVTAPLSQGLERFAPRLERLPLDAGHWVPLSHPGFVADAVAELVARVEAETPAPARRAR